MSSCPCKLLQVLTVTGCIFEVFTNWIEWFSLITILYEDRNSLMLHSLYACKSSYHPGTMKNVVSRLGCRVRKVFINELAVRKKQSWNYPSFLSIRYRWILLLEITQTYPTKIEKCADSSCSTCLMIRAHAATKIA